MRYLVTGILAHVDAGKTTLSEALLYIAGSIKKLGRVDNANAFLDTYELERARGITIFSKQAKLQYGELDITLLDTPGHVDFSAEMERTLQVLDYGILVINGSDGVQGHTRTLWRLLTSYGVPTFLFVNKMDQNGTDRAALMEQLQQTLSGDCVDFGEAETTKLWENIAVSDEVVLEHFLETGEVPDGEIRRLIWERKIFPCYFGSALKVEGIKEFLEGFSKYTCEPVYPAEFGGKVFKISRDRQGTRLTYMKITGGSLKVKTAITKLQEKVDQIRIYSGEKYEMVNEVQAGTVCAVTGLTETISGEGLGMESGSESPLLAPVLTYRIDLPEGCNPMVMLQKFRQLEEEDPELHIIWDESLQEIQAQIMGEVQIEVLKSLIQERFQIDVEFGTGNIVYKETIKDPVIGVGHFEPLRHYAEVHLLMEPGEPGSGLEFSSQVSTDDLDRNWQNLTLSQLAKKEHKGVLTGSAITDMKLTLVAGRAHLKHTEGGDFRQAAWRAVRQGLMQAETILLEPYYDFFLEVPEAVIGRAMSDVEQRGGTFEITSSEVGVSAIKGRVPVAAMRDYPNEVTAYSKGLGRLSCTYRGYEPCRNAAEIIEKIEYDPERDVENPADSVFCSHGAGMIIPWYQVKEYMHAESGLDLENSKNSEGARDFVKAGASSSEQWVGTEEIDRILNRTFNANKRIEKQSRFGRAVKRNTAPVSYGVPVKKKEVRDEYLLVDGYNIIFAWEELKELAKVNIDSARGKLLDILSNYQGTKKCDLIAVFDAYRVQGHKTEIVDYHNIHVVYTKEAETADQYIEKFAHENGRKHDVTVATSDGLEQMIIRGQGCRLLSAKDLEAEIRRTAKDTMEDFGNLRPKGKRYLFDGISEETVAQIRDIDDSAEERR